MSGTSAKEQKKQDKEKLKAFKKAFKKQTGVAADSKDTGKLLAALQVELNEMRKWTSLQTGLQPDKQAEAEGRLASWEDRVAICRKLAGGPDKKAAATRTSDTLALMLKANEAVRKMVKGKPVSKQAGGRDVNVYITDIPGFADLSSAQREQAMTVAANKTSQGLAIYEQLSGGGIDLDDPKLKVRPDEVEALIWAMKSKAQEKNGGPYQKGAMTVPNGEKMRKYLDKCPQVYSRLSSHLREAQGRNKSGGRGMTSTEGQTPRGMDFYSPAGDEHAGSLPAGMNALLYQQVVLPNGEVALYLKMESEGSYGHPGDNRKMDSTVPADRPPHPNDAARARKHLKNLLIKAKGDDKDLPGLREQTPKPVVEAINAVVAAITGKKAKASLKGSFGTEPKALLFKKVVPRISLFLDAFEKAQDRESEPGWEIGDKAYAQFDALTQLLSTLFPADVLDSDRRMGGEVVVTDADLAPAPGGNAGGGQAQNAGPAQAQDDEDDEDEDDKEPGQLRLDCAELAQMVTDPQLRARLESIVFDEILSEEDGALERFSAMVTASDVAALGPAAARFANRLLPQLEQV